MIERNKTKKNHSYTSTEISNCETCFPYHHNTLTLTSLRSGRGKMQDSSYYLHLYIMCVYVCLVLFLHWAVCVFFASFLLNIAAFKLGVLIEDVNLPGCSLHTRTDISKMCCVHPQTTCACYDDKRLSCLSDCYCFWLHYTVISCTVGGIHRKSSVRQTRGRGGVGSLNVREEVTKINSREATCNHTHLHHQQ